MITATFQSTRPRGARLKKKDDENAKKVSIHAPARGATLFSEVLHAPSTFQSTRPRGARPFVLGGTMMQSMFQSTRPRGARRASDSCHRARAASFNPRAREGRDLNVFI